MAEIRMKREYGIIYKVVGNDDEYKDENFFGTDEENVKINAISHYKRIKGLDIEVIKVYEI